MLVRFSSDAGDMIMFGEAAVTLLKMMGQSGSVPGAILAADIPAALARLQSAVATHKDAPRAPREAENDEPPVSLRQRAFPLIELLQRAGLVLSFDLVRLEHLRVIVGRPENRAQLFEADAVQRFFPDEVVARFGLVPLEDAVDWLRIRLHAA